MSYQEKRREHVNNAVTAEQVHWIKVAESQLGEINKLGEVLEHWRKTGANIKPRTIAEATEEYVKRRKTGSLPMTPRVFRGPGYAGSPNIMPGLGSTR